MTAEIPPMRSRPTLTMKDMGMDHSMHGGGMDHSMHGGMDHSAMDHSQMDHSTMDHSTMDHSGMDHSGDMDMGEIVKTLDEVGYTGVIDYDHPMRIIGDTPLPRQYIAFAVGYMRGLLNNTKPG